MTADYTSIVLQAKKLISLPGQIAELFAKRVSGGMTSYVSVWIAAFCEKA
jgi:ABC-type transporter Mla maintaining outer membrane lipid asymmetry ATPase subunit MlaF